MSETAYVRVYYTIIDDPRFAGIFDDDHHLAWWLRLLLAADAVWPASANVPRRVRSASLQALSDAGIIELQPGDRYRIHGLDAERQRRQSSGRAGASARWNADAMRPHSDGSATAMRTHSERSADAMPSRDEPSKAEPRIPARAREDDAAVAYFETTTRVPTGRSLDWLNELATAHGEAALCGAIRATDPEPVKTFLSRVQLALTDVTVGERPAPGPRSFEEFQAMQQAKARPTGVLAEIREAMG